MKHSLLKLHPSSLQTCWLTPWATLCRTLTSSCSHTVNNSTTLPTCPSLSMALRPPPPPLRPPPLPPHSSAILRTITALIAWRPPVIPAPSPTVEAWLRGLGWWGCLWGGGLGWVREGRAEDRTSYVWCVGIKHRAITTMLLPVRDVKVFLILLALPLESILYSLFFYSFTFCYNLTWSFFPLHCRFLQA